MSALHSEERSGVATVAGGALALTTAAAFAAAAHLLHDALAVGVVAGGVSALGTFWFFEYAVRKNDEADSEDGGEWSSGDDNLTSGFHRGAAGFALAPVGASTVALLYFFANPALAVAAPVALASMEYLLLSQVLPR